MAAVDACGGRPSGAARQFPNLSESEIEELIPGFVEKLSPEVFATLVREVGGRLMIDGARAAFDERHGWPDPSVNALDGSAPWQVEEDD